ncbi:hypothetical protein M3Y99_00603200 [Aphelenchoides fujianensis]|nr:hypothetical protein M3Y99_00603200 [Aphelenchoides fujianensis]
MTARLRHKARCYLLGHLSGNDAENSLLRGLLVGNSFLDSFFGHDDGPENKMMQLILDFDSVYFLSFRHCRFRFEHESIEVKAKLLLLSRIERIFVFARTPDINRKYASKMVAVCDALHECRHLDEITLRVDCPSMSTNRFVFELLPDKLVHVHSDPDVSPFLVGRQHPLESLNIFVNRMHLCLFQMLRLNARSISFFPDYDWDLADVADCGPLSPNPLLETIEIHARFNGDNEDEWAARWFPKYSNALRCLHTINSELKLKLVDWYTSFNHFHGADEIAEKVDEKLANMRTFLDFAATVGIGVETICIHIDVFFGAWQESKTKQKDDGVEKGVLLIGETKVELEFVMIRVVLAEDFE